MGLFIVFHRPYLFVRIIHMLRCYLLLLVCFLVGCGKVAQDISNQSNKSIFKVATFSFNFSENNSSQWMSIISTNNVASVYSYYQGLELDRGFEKIGWVRADLQMQLIASKNVPVISNYDMKKNIVTSSRYQQGLIQFQEVSTKNYRLTTEFRKVRPKFDYYSFAQFVSKDVYLLYISEDVPTTSVKITPYKHLVSVLYLNHLKKESYNRETVIPLTVFYDVIPTASVTPTLNVMPKNNLKSFQSTRPAFSIKSPLFDSLLTTVTLSYHSEEYDVIDYIDSTDNGIFSTNMKDRLKKSVGVYFKSKTKVNDKLTTSNVTEKTNG